MVVVHLPIPPLFWAGAISGNYCFNQRRCVGAGVRRSELKRAAEPSHVVGFCVSRKPTIPRHELFPSPPVDVDREEAFCERKYMRRIPRSLTDAREELVQIR